MRMIAVVGLAMAMAMAVDGLASPRMVAAQTDAQRCERAVLRATASYWSCLFRQRGEAALTAAPPDFGQCLERVWRRRRGLFRKYGNDACPKQLWLGGVQRFADRGDTVLDQATGLEWEKKRNLDRKPNLADARDADNRYSWTATRGGKAPDGTAFTSFLAELNKAGACFAGHCDWRLPTFAELQTILVSTEPCAANPCIDPIFGPTTGMYWSGEESVFHPIRAWYIFFINGLKTTFPKESPNYVRAVRRAP